MARRTYSHGSVKDFSLVPAASRAGRRFSPTRSRTLLVGPVWRVGAATPRGCRGGTAGAGAARTAGTIRGGRGGVVRVRSRPGRPAVGARGALGAGLVSHA